MKIRNGFVSNSSSSSFMILTSVENHEKIMKNMHPYIAAVLKRLGGRRGKLFGKDVISFTYISGNDDSFSYDPVVFDGEKPEGEDDDGKMSPYEAWDMYKKEVMKDKENVFTESASW